MDVDRLRHTLSLELLILESHLEVSGVSAPQHVTFNQDNPTTFDNLDDDPDPDSEHPDQDSTRIETQENEDVQPERRRIILPSTHMPDNPSMCQVELQLRIKQATRYLGAIRNAVAEKSFQYSHVLRLAPSKGAETRSRRLIAKVNNRIALYCRVYARSRIAMVRLGADNTILERFHVLLKEDVKASTAILKPNLPGSSNLRLSWIWQTGPSGSGPDTMRECLCIFRIDGPWH